MWDLGKIYRVRSIGSDDHKNEPSIEEGFKSYVHYNKFD